MPLRHLRLILLSMVPLVLATPARSAEVLLPPGQFIDEAIAIDLNASALDFLLAEVVDAVPDSLVVGSTPVEEVASLILCSQDFWLQNLVIHSDIHVATVQVTEGSMALVMNLDLWVNSQSSPAYLVLDGCIDDACALWMDPSNVELRLPMAFQLVTDGAGNSFVDMNFGNVQQDITTAVQTSLRLGSCGLTSLNSWFNDNLDMNLITFMIGGFVEEIEATIDQQLEDIEVDLEGALEGLWIAEETTLLEIPVDYSLAPTAVEHSEEGLRITLGGSFQAERDPCIGDLDAGGSDWSDTSLPEHYDGGEHLQLWLGDDLLNQAGYSIWRGGALCFEASELGDTALTTELLGLLIGDELQTVFGELFPEGPSELLIRSIPWNAPRIRFDGPHHITVDIDDLDIEFYGQLYQRWTRLASVSVDIRIGLDLGMDDGALSVDLTMGDEAAVPAAQYSELHGDLAPVLVSNFDAILSVALGALLGDLGEGFTMALPTMMGLGVSTLWIEPDGEQLDFLSIRAALGPSTGGESAGCDEDSGCAAGDEGCAGTAEGCGEDSSGCVDESGGCDIERGMLEAGCSGESSEGAPEQGCSGAVLEAACGQAGRARKPSNLAVLLLSLLPLALRRRRQQRELTLAMQFPPKRRGSNGHSHPTPVENQRTP